METHFSNRKYSILVKYDRCVVVIVGCCVLFMSGYIGGLVATVNDLKKLLSINQEQGERNYRPGLFILVWICF